MQLASAYANTHPHTHMYLMVLVDNVSACGGVHHHDRQRLCMRQHSVSVSRLEHKDKEAGKNKEGRIRREEEGGKKKEGRRRREGGRKERRKITKKKKTWYEMQPCPLISTHVHTWQRHIPRESAQNMFPTHCPASTATAKTQKNKTRMYTDRQRGSRIDTQNNESNGNLSHNAGL